MAVLDAVPGIRVTVESNGEALDEYPDDAEFKYKTFSAPDDRISKNYIECTSDAEFQIKFEILPGFLSAFASHVYFWAVVDGTEIGGYNGQPPIFSGALKNCVTRINDWETVRRKLKFCSLTKLDDADSDRVKEDAKLASGLGEIIVHVHRATQGAPRSYNYNPELKASATEIAEKALKGQAISHGVEFGPEQRVPHPLQPDPIYIDGYYTPLAMFRFKYRSREALQAEMIIPRSPSPDVVARPLNPRNANGGNRESNQERLSRLRREIQELEGDEDVKPKIKKEDRKRSSDASDIQSSRAYKTSRKQNGTLIVDLTDD